ncbi:hypothetical protein TEA_009760 [Camellia sinensis var. sinensis]|uniref:ABC transporter domain-containing protein n=1 Tax=Camellia sinensis var. sinensis TaxID=542762 RepID=A0A4V3WLR2_CAMSN|nr:hypothetical protein TEA_009760 [Camellia sinensis var. sinensis]
MHLDTEPPSWRRKSNQNPLDSEKKLESVHKDNYCSIAIAVATILNPLLRWRWIDSSRFDQKRLIRKHALGHRTTVLAKEIEPESIRFGEETRISSVGMSNIRRIIGVCPKFDILWDALSGQEHLHLFASIKGLPPSSIESVAQESLAEVRLTESAKIRAGSYSGGMKRLLSVAIALIGDPKLVILDEPCSNIVAEMKAWLFRIQLLSGIHCSMSLGFEEANDSLCFC